MTRRSLQIHSYRARSYPFNLKLSGGNAQLGHLVLLIVSGRLPAMAIRSNRQAADHDPVFHPVWPLRWMLLAAMIMTKDRTEAWTRGRTWRQIRHEVEHYNMDVDDEEEYGFVNLSQTATQSSQNSAQARVQKPKPSTAPPSSLPVPQGPPMEAHPLQGLLPPPSGGRAPEPVSAQGSAQPEPPRKAPPPKAKAPQQRCSVCHELGHKKTTCGRRQVALAQEAVQNQQTHQGNLQEVLEWLPPSPETGERPPPPPVPESARPTRSQAASPTSSATSAAASSQNIYGQPTVWSRSTQSGSAPPNCPVKTCNKMMIIRRARAGGKFWGCSGYPTCRSTRSIMLVERTVNTNQELGNYVADAMAHRQG